MAQEDDHSFVSMMRELDKAPEINLVDQNVRLERRLLVTSFLSITIAWAISFYLLSNLDLIFVYFLAMCNAICLEYVFLELVTKWSFQASV